MKNKPLIYVTLFSLFWAFSILTTKFVIKNGVNPIVLAPQTLFFTTSIIAIYLLITKTYSLKNVSKNSIYGSIISGIIGGGLANFAQTYGLKFTTSINAGFLVKTATAFTVLFAFLVLKEPISKLKIIFVTMLIFGAYLLSTGGKSIIPHTGDVYILLAAVGFAAASVINKFVIKKDIHPNLVSLFRAFMGFVVTLSIAIILDFSIFKFQMPGYILLISLFQSGIYIYLNKTLLVASASYMTMMSMITPVTVALFAIPLYGETLNLIQLVGAGLIVIAGIMTQIKGVADYG